MNQILVTEKVIVTPEFKRKKKIYKFNFFLSVFLVCTLSSCCIYAEYDRNKSEQVSQEILSELTVEDDTEAVATDTTNISLDDDVLVVVLTDVLGQTEESTTEVSLSSLASSNDNQLTIVASETEDGTTYYTEAILRIPSLDIEYPVLSDTSDELLKISLNKLWGPDPNEVGNYVIVGHNYKSGKMFGKLPNIEIGATIELEDLSGRTIVYEVYDKYTVEPTDTSCTSQLTDGKKEITLITCNSTGKQRIVVKAREVEE